jgi:galactose mutarotase-like enzyme
VSDAVPDSPLRNPASSRVETITSSEQGFTVHGLRTARAELKMVPELGGRVISLRSLRTGREWCWHQPRPDWLWASQPGSSFGDSPQAGIDECVPTVSACQVRGRSLPDHGEVWFQPWQLDAQALACQELLATVPLTVSPLVFSRAIRAVADGSFIFEYSLRNAGDTMEPFLWCIHPLLAMEPGDRLELPAEVRSLCLNGGIGAAIEQGDLWSYPEPFEGVRLDQLEVPGRPGGCVKGFAGPLAIGRAALVNDRTGDRLELRWKPSLAPFLGVWINRGHGGFHHVGLEPASGAPDSLADALGQWRQCGVLRPGKTVRWSITIEVA